MASPRVAPCVGTATTVLLSALILSGCRAPDAKATGSARSQSTAPAPAAGPPGTTGAAWPRALADTRWRLVGFQSMDDATGTVRPDDPSRYTMRLDRDGTVTMRLDCNRGRGTWSARSGADGASGQFEFGPLAVTRARCPPPSMGEKIAAHAEFVRSYLLKDGRLYLSLMADGGIYEWEPDPDEPSAAGVPAPPETGGPRDWEVTATLNLREQPSAEALRPAASPDGRVAKGPDDSALRAGEGRFDATGTIRRAQWRGQPTARCEFGVARAGGSYATVVIKKPDGRTRAVCFRMGKPIGADTSEAESGEFSARREGDLNVIRVGSEGYEIPDAVALGG